MKTTVGESFIFGRDGNARDAQLHGWSGGEDGFTWTLGIESGLRLARPNAPHGFFIELNVHPFMRKPSPTSQRMQLLIDDRKVADVVLDHGGVFAFYVSGASFPDGPLHLTIRHPDATRPEPTGRDLALAFRSIRILCLAGPLPEWKHRFSAIPLPTGDPIVNLDAAFAISAPELVSSFETIAGNCEFGALQRLCGVEPLSLLRFAGASVAAAVTGLDTEFAGLGEDIEPQIAPNSMREWMIVDHQYKLNYHTMISSDNVSADKIVAMERRKVQFLRRKFLEDVVDAAKIYVLSSQFPTDAAEAMALFLALRRRGAAWMLWVQVAPDRQQAGNVEQTAPGLMLGYIDRLAPRIDGTDISLSGWLSLLANAWSLRRRELAG
jgi:hypothetical protein